MSGGMYTSGGGEADRDRRVVGVSGYVVTADGETLVAYGLGSCVAIALEDPDNRVAALAHTMLPRQPEESTAAPGKYADATVRAVLQEMVDKGAAYGSIRGWLAGGADIFPLGDLDLPERIGERTVRVARTELEGLGVSIVAESVGGDRGRTVEFDTATGEVVVRQTGEDGRRLGHSAGNRTED